MTAQKHLVSVSATTTAQSSESIEINFTSTVFEETAITVENSISSTLSTNSSVPNADGDDFNKTTPAIIEVSADNVTSRINPSKLIGKDVERIAKKTSHCE